MNDSQYVSQTDFNDFKETFIRFEAANEERQKSIDHKLDELLKAKEKGVEHDSTQAALITDLNAQVLSLNEQVGGLRESRNTMREQITDAEKEIGDLKTERRTLNWALGIGLSIAVIISPIVSELVGNWLTK